jgi:hypothetical protein
MSNTRHFPTNSWMVVPSTTMMNVSVSDVGCYSVIRTL